jgi:hypothetical protein
MWRVPRSPTIGVDSAAAARDVHRFVRVPRLGAHPYKSAIGRQDDNFGTPRVFETTGVAEAQTQ